ncbi:MAG: Arc family DNA-binding protein [Bacteroidales bacterium]
MKAFTFLLAEELLERIKKSAEANERAVGQEIRYALEQYYRGNMQA